MIQSPRVFRHIVRAGLTCAITISSAGLLADGRAPLVRLNVVRSTPDVVHIEPTSGWPLTIELRARNNRLEGIGRPTVGTAVFPAENNQAFLVFDDPDNCPSFIPEFLQTDFVNTMGAGDPFPGCALNTPIPWVRDEWAAEFRSGVSSLDSTGVEEIGPTINTFDFDTSANTRPEEIGPDLGSVDDDISWGAHPRLPGLVLVADRGPSLVADENGDISGPLQCRNAAGFLSTVNHQFSDRRGSTSIRAHMSVPRKLFTPVFQVDRSITTNSMCPNSRAIFRLDGGPLQCDDSFQTIFVDGLNDTVTLRAFLVNIDAYGPNEPLDVVEDLNGNGKCDAHDAYLAGYQLLSREEEVRFSQFHEFEVGLVTDFDGNGDAGSVVAPAGRGTIRFPPR